jgi:hypothetical protein
MQHRSTRYFVILCGLSLFGVILSSSNFVVRWLATIFSLGILTVVLPALFFFLLALVPAVVANEFGAGRRIVVALALAGLLAVGVGIPFGANMMAVREVARFQSTDTEQAATQRPRSIEFVRSSHSNDFGRPLFNAPCEAICQTLLLNDEADVVVVAAEAPSRGGLLDRVAYRRERRAVCPLVFDAAGTALRETVWALAEGDCIVPEPDSTAPVAVTVRDFTLDGRAAGFGGEGDSFAILLGNKRRLEIVDWTRAPDAPVYRKTAIGGRVLAYPLSLTFPAYYPSFVTQVRLLRRWTVLNPIDVEDDLRRVLGYRLTAIAAHPPLAGRDIARLVMDRPGNEIVDPALMHAIETGMEHLKEKPSLSKDDIDLIRRMVEDRRVFRNSEPFVPVLFGHRDLLLTLLPDLIARLESLPDNTVRPRRGTIDLIMTLSLSDVAPHVERLRALTKRDVWWAPKLADGLNKLSSGCRGMILLPICEAPPRPSLTATECGKLGGRISLEGACATRFTCTTIDENNLEHSVCLTAMK